MAIAPSCAELLDIGDLGVAPAPVDAGDAGREDIALRESGADAPTTCSPGAVVQPEIVFDPAPDGGTPACRVQNARDNDGVGAGLDNFGTVTTTLAGMTVTGCVAARFDGPLESATVRLRSIANACGAACGGAACSTGREVDTFAGPEESTVHYVGRRDVTDTFRDYPVALQPPDRVVIICRTIDGVFRDDIEVDSMLGNCR